MFGLVTWLEYDLISNCGVVKRGLKGSWEQAKMQGTRMSKKPEIVYGSVHDAATDRIREMILGGQVVPGERLRQDDLATTLGVSTMPVREALRQLQVEGLVVFYPRKGAVVARLSICVRVRGDLSHSGRARDFGLPMGRRGLQQGPFDSTATCLGGLGGG